jgi:tripartite-type tricarboxylate transporter receptor subunit TctC
VYTTGLNIHAYSNLPYSSKDFLPIIHFGYLYAALIVNPSVPVNTLQELLTLAKQKPNTLAFGTPGPATNASMYVEYWRKNQTASFLNVPYKSFVQSLNAVVSGEVQATIFGTGQAMAQVRAGKAKALAIIGQTRTRNAPGVPTISEAGVDLTISNWGGVLAPTGTSREVITRINTEFKKAIADPVLREKYLEGQGFEQAPPSGGTPEEFGAFLQAEHQKLGRIVQITGLRLD